MSRKIEITEPAGGGSGIPPSTVTAKGDLIVATANATVTNLPVGSDGQVLTADSTKTDGIKWAAASGGATGGYEQFRIKGSGQNRRYIAGQNLAVSAASGSSVAINTLWFVPFVNIVACSVDKLAFKVNTGGAAGSVARCGLYSAKTDGTLQPNALLADGGEFATTGTGVMEATIGSPVAFAADTVYWAAYVAGTAAPSVAVVANAGLPLLGRDAASWADATMMSAPFTYGALPADTSALTLAYSSNNAVMIAMRLT